MPCVAGHESGSDRLLAASARKKVGEKRWLSVDGQYRRVTTLSEAERRVSAPVHRGFRARVVSHQEASMVGKTLN